MVYALHAKYLRNSNQSPKSAQSRIVSVFRHVICKHIIFFNMGLYSRGFVFSECWWIKVFCCSGWNLFIIWSTCNTETGTLYEHPILYIRFNFHLIDSLIWTSMHKSIFFSTMKTFQKCRSSVHTNKRVVGYTSNKTKPNGINTKHICNTQICIIN